MKASLFEVAVADVKALDVRLSELHLTCARDLFVTQLNTLTALLPASESCVRRLWTNWILKMADEKFQEELEQMDIPEPVVKIVPRRGRPPLLPGAPRSDKKPRSVRLNESRWRKLQRLGPAWLEQAIDNAVDPGLTGGRRKAQSH